MNTLALRGLEEPFFQLCCCFSFLFWREIVFGFTYYLCTLSTIQLWCCVSFFGTGGKWFLVLRTYLLYNTVVQLCQFFCCGGKVNFAQIPYSHDRFSKILRTFFVKKFIRYKTYVREDQLFLALYGSTFIQSGLFLKNNENFVWFPKQYLLGFFFLDKQLANIPDRGFLFLRNTLFHFSLSPYSQTESQTEERIHLLHMGLRNFFYSCAVVSVFGSGGEKVLVLNTYVRRVQYSCGVVLVFGSGGK